MNLDELKKLPAEQKQALIHLLDEKIKRKELQEQRDSLISFCHAMYPGYSAGAHHRHIAKIFKDVLEGRKKRVIINIAPRFGKSLLTSYLFPAWFLGHRPDAKILMATHTATLSEDFSKMVRNLIATPEYLEVFPRARLADDSTGAASWGTAAGGKYFAVGVGGSIAGRGADLCVIDDPHALEINTEIPTPTGFKTMGELRVGDFVFAPDGKPTKILGKSRVYENRQLCCVVTDDGEEIYCDEQHLWTYHSETALAKKHLLKTETAQKLSRWSKPNAPYLPQHAPVCYPEQALPIDPYVLGAWLGDGTSSLGRMTSHPDDMPFMRAQFEAAGYTTTALKDPYSFGVHSLRAHLIGVGLLNAKHIPEKYLRGSVVQRMALLQGLMDTDGNVTSAGQCCFQNTNRRLAEGVRELLHSLGVKAKLHVYHDNRKRHKTRKADYRVTFKLKDAARMPRKRARTFTPTDKRRRSITVFKTREYGSVQCITVDNADGLFLAGRGYVVTHNSEQDVKTGSRTVFDQAWTWYQTGPRQRLQWGGAIVILMTRWGLLDLTARLIDHQIKNPDGDQWEVVEFPALLNEHTEKEKSLWPEKWSLESLRATRADIDPRYWVSQYQQNPTSEVTAIIKREYWRLWEPEDPPPCSYLIMSVDTAHEAKTTADYSACTMWGVFYEEIQTGRDAGKQAPNIILLDAFRDRMEFPELKEVLYKHWKEWQPDTFLVEKKAAGAPLIQEFRRMGIPVQEYSPTRTKGPNDKVARLNAVSDIFASGKVWAPDRRWAKEVIEEVASFPIGTHDDFVDTVSQALLRFRQGGFISLDSDEEQEARAARRRTARPYY